MNLMKKILFIIIAVISFFIGSDDVYANLTWSNTEIECIYANGVVIGMNYDVSSMKRNVYVKEYPLSSTVVFDFEKLSNISIYDAEKAIDELSKLTCPESVRYWIAYETVSSNRSYRGVYNFSTKASDGQNVTNKLILGTGWYSDAKKNLGVVPAKFKSGNDVGGAKQSNCSVGSYSVHADDDGVGGGWVKDPKTGKSCSPEATIPLVAERLYLVDDIGKDAYDHTFKAVGKTSEAVGISRYAQIYKDENHGFYLQIGKNITRVNTKKLEEIGQAKKGGEVYICVKESVATQDASRGDSSYKFSSVRHEIGEVGTADIECKNGEQKFVKTTENCMFEIKPKKDSFCDKYTNTAYVLADIINLAQILVPVFVLVLTSIDIARIVIAGNLEEELPKRKKSLIIRLVIMISFLFLPTITKLIISLASGVTILDVECLFNDGHTPVVSPCDKCSEDYYTCVDDRCSSDDKDCLKICEEEFNTCYKNNCQSNCVS